MEVTKSAGSETGSDERFIDRKANLINEYEIDDEDLPREKEIDFSAPLRGYVKRKNEDAQQLKGRLREKEKLAKKCEGSDMKYEERMKYYILGKNKHPCKAFGKNRFDLEGKEELVQRGKKGHVERRLQIIDEDTDVCRNNLIHVTSQWTDNPGKVNWMLQVNNDICYINPQIYARLSHAGLIFAAMLISAISILICYRYWRRRTRQYTLKHNTQTTLSPMMEGMLRYKYNNILDKIVKRYVENKKELREDEEEKESIVEVLRRVKHALIETSKVFCNEQKVCTLFPASCSGVNNNEECDCLTIDEMLNEDKNTKKLEEVLLKYHLRATTDVDDTFVNDLKATPNRFKVFMHNLGKLIMKKLRMMQQSRSLFFENPRLREKHQTSEVEAVLRGAQEPMETTISEEYITDHPQVVVNLDFDQESASFHVTDLPCVDKLDSYYNGSVYIAKWKIPDVSGISNLDDIIKQTTEDCALEDIEMAERNRRILEDSICMEGSSLHLLDESLNCEQDQGRETQIINAEQEPPVASSEIRSQHLSVNDPHESLVNKLALSDISPQSSEAHSSSNECISAQSDENTISHSNDNSSQQIITVKQKALREDKDNLLADQVLHPESGASQDTKLVLRDSSSSLLLVSPHSSTDFPPSSLSSASSTTNSESTICSAIADELPPFHSDDDSI